jgi:hypothetical protein
MSKFKLWLRKCPATKLIYINSGYVLILAMSFVSTIADALFIDQF